MGDKELEKIILTGKAAEDLIRLRIDTPEHLLPEMTRVSAREAWMMAGIKTFNEGREFTAALAQYQDAIKKNPKQKTVKEPQNFFFSDRFNFWLMKFKRSIGGAGVDSIDEMTRNAIQTDVPTEDYEGGTDAA